MLAQAWSVQHSDHVRFEWLDFDADVVAPINDNVPIRAAMIDPHEIVVMRELNVLRLGLPGLEIGATRADAQIDLRS